MAVAACKQAGSVPRPTIGLVQSIVEDTTGVRELVAKAGWNGADGSIALLGEPEDVVVLARRFRFTDRMDNVDGRQKPGRSPTPCRISPARRFMPSWMLTMPLITSSWVGRRAWTASGK